MEKDGEEGRVVRRGGRMAVAVARDGGDDVCQIINVDVAAT